MAHAGEEGPSSYVCEALDDLKVQRIDHGNRALEDPSLVRRIAREKIPLTVCPLSNKRLQVCPDLTKHPLRQMLDAGLIVTINLGIGQQTPPVASVLMVASSIARASVWEVTRVNVWFIGVLLAVLMLVTYVPVTGMGLVEAFYR